MIGGSSEYGTIIPLCELVRFDYTAPAADAYVTLRITSADGDGLFSIYHVAVADAQQIELVDPRNTLTAPTDVLARTMCDLRVVLRVDCTDKYSPLSLEIETSGPYLDVYFDTSDMYDDNGALYNPASLDDLSLLTTTRKQTLTPEHRAILTIPVFQSNPNKATLRVRVMHIEDRIRPLGAPLTPLSVTQTVVVRFNMTRPALCPGCIERTVSCKHVYSTNLIDDRTAETSLLISVPVSAGTSSSGRRLQARDGQMNGLQINVSWDGTAPNPLGPVYTNKEVQHVGFKCPQGMAALRSLQECATASAALGHPLPTQINNQNEPRGCYVYSTPVGTYPPCFGSWCDG